MKRFVTKFCILLLTFGVAGLLAAACGEETSEVVGILKSNGFNVGAESDERLVFIGAPQDTSVKVNGHDVLIYRFPDRDDLREGIIAIEDIISAGTGLWGYDQENPGASYHERGLYIVYFGDHPDADRIRQVMDDNIKYLEIEEEEE
ncbi:MAG: hypothetical protein F4X72_10470 [Dehalococcoidia bacterium]|nr:hypothetical protein [Dehalococcoidia bacterium]